MVTFDMAAVAAGSAVHRPDLTARRFWSILIKFNIGTIVVTEHD